jgi:hypothetical protein
MMRITLRLVRAVFVLTVAAAIVALTTAGGHAILLDVYLLCLGAVLLLALVRATRVHAEPSRRSQFDSALAGVGKVRPDSGEPTLTRDLELSTYNAFHLHARVRPVLRDVAADRLRTRYGLELDAEPERARELVGADAWELVRPERQPPRDRMATGPTVDELRVVVDQLEAI